METANPYRSPEEMCGDPPSQAHIARAHEWGNLTLVEWLVVFAIIGILVALMLPPIHAAR